MSDKENPKDLVKILADRYLGMGEDEYNAEEYIDILESIIEKANAAARDGNEIMPDSVYDSCMDMLRTCNPNSPVLHQVWSGDDDTVAFDYDIDMYLSKNPMMSIQTVKALSDKSVQDFITRLPEGDIRGMASLKENGFGIRIVYVGNSLIKATTRGRSTNGKDITRQLKLICGEENAKLDGDKVFEIRGELLLPLKSLSTAKKYNANIKSAFTAVSSMLRDSATAEETKLLRFVAYDVITEDLEPFKSLSEKYKWLTEHGFETPMFATFAFTRENAVDTMKNCVDAFAKNSENYAYYTDGVVFGVDNIEMFNAMGSTDKYRYGNLALKIGRWRQDNYTGRVTGIKWVTGKSKLTPVAQVCDPDDSTKGVLTMTGNTVVNVPLYAPCYILMLEAYEGNLINFKYGGEAGVIPCFPDGSLVTDKESHAQYVLDNVQTEVNTTEDEEDDVDYSDYDDDDIF